MLQLQNVYKSEIELQILLNGVKYYKLKWFDGIDFLVFTIFME